MPFDPQVLIAFSTLTILEIVLGIDNVIFISILTSKLPKEQQTKGYVYFAMAFSVFVEMLNLRVHAKSKAKPVQLHGPRQ